MPNNHLISIEVVFADKDICKVLALQVKPESTIEEVILQSGMLESFSQIDLKVNAVGIFGELKTLETSVQAGDRVEIYRPLAQSPMALRKAKVPVKSKPKSKPRQRPVRNPD